jgi:hypothetical protein
VGDEIEHHLRLCTAATNGSDLLFTIAGPELLPAEAATKTMATSKMNPIKSHRLTVSRLEIRLMSMKDDMYVDCISFRERSELVAALLVMRACDVQAMLTSQRWVPVPIHGKVGCEFGTTALPKFAYKGEDELHFQEAFKEFPI